jgi:phage tail sheath protein FI
LTASARLGETVEGSSMPSKGPGYTGNLGMRGANTGSIKLGSQEFVMLLNGHKGSSNYPRVVTASMDYRNPNYFANVFNTDSTKIEEAGHYLYGRYDIHPALAVVTGVGVFTPGATEAKDTSYNDAVFLTTGAFAQNTGASNGPNYESFETRYTTAFSPYVISQDFGGAPYDVFRVEALSDGAVSTDRFKISIENIKKTNSDTDKFGSFDVVVRQFDDTDELPVVLEAFRGVDLDPTSGRFIARVIGDQKAYYNFDANSGAQKLIVEGDYPNNSRLVRIKQSVALKKSEIPDEGLPMGFRGPYHLVTSGSTQLNDITSSYGHTAGDDWNYVDTSAQLGLRNAVEPPIPFRETVTLGTGQTKRAKSSLYWGVQFSNKEDLNEPNKVSLFNPTMRTYAKFFPRFEGSAQDFSVGNNAGIADPLSGSILDSDRFNNNKFSLEKLQVRTGSDTLADPSYWLSASYARKGTIVADETNKTRAFKVDDLKSAGNRNYAKFTFFLQGGFDGTNIFNKDKMNLTNAAAIREMDDATAQGATSGPTVASFRKAIDIMGNTSDVSIKLLTIPGMRETGITDYAIDAVESRFDALYIMDIEERDTLNTVVTSSAQVVHVKNTTTDFTNRALDTSFAAAYFPDVIQRDPGVGTNIQVPPSVAVLGAFALNDAIGHPWFAPAGFSRGALRDAQRASVELKRANLDDLYDVDVNPITDFPGTGLVVFGQKTLLAAASALDRVNVRRLLIEIRRNVRTVANTLLFEPNRQTTLDKFNALVNPILQAIQEQNGLERFKVIVDSTTTTHADVENNTIRGKIYVQPTRTIEFIALDFVVTNAGAGA